MVALTLALALVGCEKDSGLSSKTSGKLSGAESSLLADLPGGNVALFGGNYLKLQDFAQNSAIGRLIGSLQQVAPGLKEWTACFVNQRGVQMMGAVAYADGALTMRYVMKGFDVAQIESCAAKAGFRSQVDADRRFVAIEMPGPLGTSTVGYLALADGALLTRAAMPIPPAAMLPPPVERAALEADVAAAARGNATEDAALVAELGRIDRSRAMWFVGDASDTPIGDKVGLMRGWVDIGGGISLDVSAQVKDAAIAEQIAAGVPMAKREAGKLGGEVGNVVRGLRFERKGDRLRFAIKMTDRQIDALMEQLAPFLPRSAGPAGGPVEFDF